MQQLTPKHEVNRVSAGHGELLQATPFPPAIGSRSASSSPLDTSACAFFWLKKLTTSDLLKEN